VTRHYANRLDRAAEEVQRAGLEGLVVTPSADLLYLAGYDAPQLPRLTALVVRPSHDSILLVPELERPRAEASPAGGLVEIEIWRDGEDPHQALRHILSDGARYGATDRMWAVHLLEMQRALPEASFVPASPVLSKLRGRKDAAEIHLLGRAARGADEAFRRLGREGLLGRAEEDIARSLGQHLIEAGHDSVSFTIVAAGPNGASPHHEPSGRSVRGGDAVVLDFGGRVGGYCSDITRTVSVGEPAEEVREVHAIVREAQETAFRAVRPGVPAEEIDRAARRVIEDAGYGPAFVHRTGHGIGLEEQEAPYLVEGNTDPLEEGHCFSIEPGIYLEGRFGVRIEDIVTVTAGGATRLNNAPRELTVVA
jgi:Xaa-Pro aminopeptidase